jgi:hypothetical protein
MSFVITRPELLAQATRHLTGGVSMTAATWLLPAAAYEVSASTATCFDAQVGALYETEAVNAVAARQGG